MLTDLTVRAYAEQLASGQATPGGGSGAALVGALGAALGEMVGNFTAGKPTWAQIEPALRRLTECREGLLALTDQDAEAYGAVAAAYGLPRETDEQKAARSAAIQEALKGAAKVPLAAVGLIAEAVGQLPAILEYGNVNVLSDVAVAAQLCQAAIHCAWLNVEVNLAYIKDEEYNQATRAGLAEIVADGEDTATEVWEQTLARIVKQ
jgi:methenyltetrahydrofolate cyclohydrolase